MPADLTPPEPSPSEVPRAPWALVGECMVAVVRGGPAAARRSAYPKGVRPLPGPTLVVGVRYTASPVGPFLELAVAQPARIGLRIGLCFTVSVVSSPPARVGGRLGWGMPRELGSLTWSTDGDESRLRWEDRGIEIAGGAHGWPVPLLVPVRSLQRRADGPVVVPGRLRGRARLGSVEVLVPPDDRAAWLAGRHRGIVLHGMRMVLKPARRPAGLLSSLGAPLHAAEPAMSQGSGIAVAEAGVVRSAASTRYSAPSPRALSSVG